MNILTDVASGVNSGNLVNMLPTLILFLIIEPHSVLAYKHISTYVCFATFTGHVSLLKQRTRYAQYIPHLHNKFIILNMHILENIENALYLVMFFAR